MDEFDYQSALKRLYDRINYERSGHTQYTAQNYRLDRMRRLLDRLGNPQEQYDIIHIAGTKGKGTTATLIYEALRANGRKVGLYTSPHLLHVEERFQFDGRICSRAEMTQLVRRVLTATDEVEGFGLGSPTFFEITTAIGLLHFAMSDADSAVVEVGLGGRLDSTNVCSPLLTLITSISLDHQAQLGSTIAAIAREKAGIIKPNVPLISTALHPDAIAVIDEVAKSNNAERLQLDRDFAVQWLATKNHRLSTQSDSCFAEVSYYPSRSINPFALGSEPWPLSLLGKHQAHNLGGVVTALNWLATRAGWQIAPARTRKAIAEARIPGRLQIVSAQPVRIIDTAHNPASVGAALSALHDHFGDVPKTFVFASSRDKDYRTMLGQLLPGCDRLICTAFVKNPRAVSPQDLSDCAKEVACSLLKSDSNVKLGTIELIENPLSAWAEACDSAPEDGLVISIGSFFLAAELLEAIQ